MATKKYYAWSELRNGGEIKDIDLPANRGKRTIITSRNIVAHGDAVSQKELGVTDEEWQGLIDGGSVRDYPVPDGTDAYRSPSQAFLAQVTDGKGDVDMNKLMELGLSNPPVINPPAEEEAQIAVGA